MCFDLATALACAGLLTGGQAAQTPPIFNPGAPGQPSRAVTIEQAHALGRTSFSPADVAFMQHMIVHHAQAVEMVRLLETRGADPRVGLLGRRIALSQAAEMQLMRAWLTEREQPLEMQGADQGVHAGMDHSGHPGHGTSHPGHAAAPDDTPVMAGMLSPRQMRELAAAGGPAFDRLFLTGMIQHHQGALDMVEALMATPNAAEDTLMSAFTASVIADQSAEILRMRSLLSEP